MTLPSLVKAAAYASLDVLFLGRGVRRTIMGESIRFPARYCRYYPGDYEAATFAFLRAHCKPGATAIDVGAHIGLFSVLMARLVGPTGRVFSFEPTPVTAAVLARVIELNGYAGSVETLPEAVSSGTGTATFFDTGDLVSNANSLVCTAGKNTAISVRTTSIDEFVQNRVLTCNCLKIDAEGAELEVLRGARRTLAEHRPAVSLSLHPRAIREAGGSLGAVWELIQEQHMGVTCQNAPVEADWFKRQEELFDVQLLPQR